jgi:hypothetical protein
MIALDVRKVALTVVGRMTITCLSVTDAVRQQPMQKSLFTMAITIIAKIVGVKGIMKWE